jgi:DNA polymerase elongation subunit (family B)
MFLAISHDAVFREFSSVSLKVVPVELGLRPGKRLDMSTHEMQAAYDSGDYSRMREYLEYDLEDTQLLADYFMPTLYPQQYYFPGYTLRNLAVVGGGSKWQNAIAACYPQSYTDSLEDTPKLKYQGALTYTRCGLFRDVIGVDLSGAYPNANIFYGICSEKDPEMWSLAILKHAVKSRNAIKYKENITAYDESLAKAAKPVINSQYGSCASKIPYGDPAAAAITTAFTRARLKWLRGYVESLGGTVVLQDTDSCFFYFPVSPGVLPIPKSGKVTLADSPQGLPQFLPGLTVARLLKEASPPGVDLDLDSINRVMFVPPIAVKADYRKNYKLSSVNGRKFARKHLGDSVDSPLFDKLLSQYGSDKVSYELLKVLAEALQVQFPGVEGLKKNYIKFKWDKKSNDWVIELKGRFVKRDCTDLERTYQRNFILKYLGSPLDAEVYHQDTLQRISDQTYPVEFLTTNRKIRITEKTLVARGLGQPRETISFYQGVDGPTKNGPYDSHFYIQKVERMYQEIKEMIALEPEVETVLEICS